MKFFFPFVRRLRSRLPARSDILQVFSFVLFVVCGWSIRGFLYKIPAFSLYFSLGANLAVLCYMLGFALLESILVTAVLVVLAALLPARLFKEGFAYKGFVAVVVSTIAMILFEGYYQVEYFKDILAHNYSSIPPFVAGLLGAVGSLTALLWLFHHRPALQKYALYLLEQLSLFTYIYVPLGLLGLIVVIARNLP
jgi:hypothetical protein